MTATARILIVDDEAHVLSSLKRLFRPSGYETSTCGSAKEALQLIETSPPFDLVISDYRMPEMDGVEFLTKVRSCSPDSVRMVLSGFADAGSIMAATNEGHIYKFIPKPWDDVFLLASVSDALDYHASKREQQNLIIALKSNLDKMVTPLNSEECGYKQTLQAYESLLDFMPVGLIGVDSAGVIVKMNQFAVSDLKLDSMLVGSTLEALPLPLAELIAKGGGAIASYDAFPLVLNGQDVLVFIKRFSKSGMEGLMLVIVLMPLPDGGTP
ncbi:MAG: response regulator [Deltaproteobacteria bacterium]|nr:response regulator [Deltaproteobacteria bacterium]